MCEVREHEGSAFAEVLVDLGAHRLLARITRLSLHDLESPYAHVLDAVAALLPALTVTERAEVARLAREGPPEETVGLEPYGPPEAMPV